MTRTLFCITLAAAAALAGCNKDDHTIVAGGDPADEPTNAAANTGVQLPPAITASKTYRCADNSLVYIDWLSDGTSKVKQSANDAGTQLPAGDPSLKGDAHAATVTYKGQSCKA